MRIVIPYVPGKLHRDTRAWGQHHGAEFHEVGVDRRAYFRLLSKLWAAKRAFMIVEHDNVPGAGAVGKLAACPELWCGCPYTYGGTRKLEGELGCTRFSERLLASFPDAVEATSGERFVLDLGKSRDDFRWLYLRLGRVLRREGFQFHPHPIETAHFHPESHLWRQNVQELAELVSALESLELEVEFAQRAGDCEHLQEVGAMAVEARELLRRTTAQLTGEQLTVVSQRLGMSSHLK